jgi:hypothetical protein
MNDSIKVSNKIISTDLLGQILDAMNNRFEELMKVAREEEKNNSILDYQYQNYTFKNANSEYIFTINYYDNTSVKYGNYVSFMTAFRNRIEDIKEIDIKLYLNYSTKVINGTSDFLSQSIYLSLREDKVTMDFRLESKDDRLRDIYDFIRSLINNAPVKYDTIIKKRRIITSVIGFAKGFIPSAIICVVLLTNVNARQIAAESYVLFPITVLFLSSALGSSLFTLSITNLYKNIIPKVEYAGYSTKYGTMYKENIDNYIETSEVIIGKNTNNIKNREKIEEIYDKYKKFVPIELAILVILSIVVVLL